MSEWREGGTNRLVIGHWLSAVWRCGCWCTWTGVAVGGGGGGGGDVRGKKRIKSGEFVGQIRRRRRTTTTTTVCVREELVKFEVRTL